MRAQHARGPLVQYWWEGDGFLIGVGNDGGWGEALRQVSGVGFDEFNRAFKEWLLSQIPHLVHVTVDVRWPRMGSPAQ